MLPRRLLPDPIHARIHPETSGAICAGHGGGSAISFSLFNFVGDPVNNMVGQDATREQRVQIRIDLGLDDPILVQYTRFMGHALQGDFGLSYRIKRPVDELIFERLPAND